MDIKKVIHKEEMKIKNLKNKIYIKAFLFLLIKIILLNITRIKAENDFTSEIKLVIQGKGSQYLLYQEFNIMPSEILVNGISVDSIYYNLNEASNDIVLRFNVTITSCYRMFYSLSNIKKVNLSNFDFSNTINLTSMFHGCSKLTSVIFGNINTSLVESMDYLFCNCYYLYHIDLSKLDFSQVSDIGYMFSGCSSLYIINSGNINTFSLKNMKGLFKGCSSLTSVDFSNFDISKVTDVGEMFFGCSRLKQVNFEDIKTSEVVNMNSLFRGCYSLTSIDLSFFNFSKVEDIGYMFSNCYQLKVQNINFGNIDSSSLQNMKGTFQYCYNLTSMDLSIFDFSKVTDLGYMFYRCSQLKEIEFGNMETPELLNLNSLFGECPNLTSIDLSTFDFSKVTDIGNMFYRCSSLKFENINFGNINSSSLKNMRGLFQRCINLTSLDLSGFDLSHVTDIGYMISGCQKLKLENVNFGNITNSEITEIDGLFDGLIELTSIDLSFMDLSKVKNINYLFSGCSKLEKINFGNLNTSEPTSVYGLFEGCSSLTSIDLSPINFSNITDIDNMFSGCSKLENINFGNMDKAKPTYIYGLFEGCSSLTSLDISFLDFSEVEEIDSLFSGCSKLEKINFGNIETPQLTYIYNLFGDCSSLTSVDFSNFNFENVNDIGYLFSGCSKLKFENINFGNIKEANLEYMTGLFEGCAELTSIDLSIFNLENVIDISYMFSQCSKLKIENINFGNLIKAKPSYAQGLFINCSSLSSIDLSFIDFSKISYMNDMFNGCSNIEKINFGNTNFSSLMNIQSLFHGCSKLISLNLLNFNTSKITDMSYMFSGCTNLKYLNLSNFNTTKVKNIKAMFENCSSLIYLNLEPFVLNYTIVNKTWAFSGISPIVKYCINDNKTKYFLIGEQISLCSDICFQPNIKIDLNNNICLESCFENGYNKEYNNICYYECPKGTLLNNNLCEDNICLNNYEDNLLNCSGKTPEGYYLDTYDNLYKKCFYKCKYCYGPGNETENNCIECKDNFMFLKKNESICYEICEFFYYYNELNEYKCTLNNTCPLGFNKLIVSKNECVNECKTNDDLNTLYEYKNFCYEKCPNNTFKLLNNQKYLCVDEIPEDYYFDIKEETYKKCYKTCKVCYNEGDEINNMNCKICINNYFLLNGTNNCYNESLLNKGYYLKNDTFYPCHKSCSKCNTPLDIIKENQNCIECNLKDDYYPLNEDNSLCYNNETIKEGYYLKNETSSFVWKKCHERCKKCSREGDIFNMNCISCKSNLINNKTNEIYYFNLINGNCIQTCPNNLLLTPFEECVDRCPNGTYEYPLNNTCLTFCPNNYEINKDQNKCVLIKFDANTTVSEFKNKIEDNIVNLVNSSAVINGSDFIAVVLSSDDMDPEEQLKNGISAIDLGNCTQVIKEYYNISSEENLIILNIESKNDKTKKKETENNNNKDNSFNLGKNMQIEVFDNSGRKLNLSVCKQDIKIMKYIGGVEELNIESAKSLSLQGIDVFNASDDYFNDICIEVDNEEGKDIIINDRRNDIYQNATFCQEGCTYSGMDYKLMTANCICDSNFLQGEKDITNEEINKQPETANFKSITKSFISNLLQFNFDVVKCSNLVFNKKILIKNIGFFVLAIMQFLQIIFLFIYLNKKLRKIKYFMINYKNDNINNMKQNFSTKNINGLKNSAKNNIKNTNLKFDKLNNKQKLIKKKLVNNRLKKKENHLSKIDASSKSNSHRNIFSDDTPNFINVLKNEVNNNDLLNLNLQKSNKIDKNSQKNYIILNNNKQIINIQNQNFNIKKGKESKAIKNINNERLNNKKELNKIKLETKIKGQNNSKRKFNRGKPHKKNNKLRTQNIDKKQNLCNIETLQNKENIKTKDNNKIKTKINDKVVDANKKINLFLTDSEIQDMDYKEAIIMDKRSIFRMYWSFLVDSQVILGTFYTENHLNLFVIKLSFLIFTFQLSFFLNSLFYTDDYISDAYHNDGILDFFSGLPKAIYSFIATLITTNLLKMLSNSQSELMKITREKSKYKNYRDIINIKLSKLRKKLIVYFILVFSLGIFFIYYVASFCAVYRYSQKYLFIGCLESFGIDSVVGICICIVLALFRFISIKKKIKCFYILANIISMFL